MASWGIGMTGNGRHSYRSERQCAGLEARDFDASALSMSWKRRGRFRQPPGTARPAGHAGRRAFGPQGDRKSVVEGKSVYVRLDLGGRLSIKNKKRPTQ